jgi:signal transduction histidine kinase
VEEAKVFVVSDDRAFVDAIEQSWQQSRYSPKFTVVGTGEGVEFGRKAVVLTDSLSALAGLTDGVVLAIAITGDDVAVNGPELEMPEAEGCLRVVRIPRRAGWAGHAAALAQETMLRLESQAQAADAKQRLREAERFAALGRFIAEARHGLGNALTGVLGHSELLLLDSGKPLQGETRAQVETIRQMSLKIHETFQRLSSLDVELRLAEGAERDSSGGPVH